MKLNPIIHIFVFFLIIGVSVGAYFVIKNYTKKKHVSSDVKNTGICHAMYCGPFETTVFRSQDCSIPFKSPMYTSGGYKYNLVGTASTKAELLKLYMCTSKNSGHIGQGINGV